MKIIYSLIVLSLFILPVFSQTTNSITLEECLEGAVGSHPLQKSKSILSGMLSSQNTILDKGALPSLAWKGQARLQSESVQLDFDNPMFPSFELPIYSAQSTVELNYTLYDGGMRKAAKAINEQSHLLQTEQITVAIDPVKQQVLAQYLFILFLQQKEQVLQNSLDLVRENIQTMEAAWKQGVVKKTDLQQLIIKEKELESNSKANRIDIETAYHLLANLTGLTLTDQPSLVNPELANFEIDTQVDPGKTKLFDLEKNLLDAQADVIDRKNKPKVFAFLNAGAGYPNPLNFFDDSLSPFAVAGLGFSWSFIDWGKSREEKQLLKLQQDLIDVQRENTVEMLNRQNDKYALGVAKFQQLSLDEKELIDLKKDIAEMQKDRLQKGVILPVEYLSNLNEIIQSELNLNRYELEILKLKLEYQLLKGKL